VRSKLAWNGNEALTRGGAVSMLCEQTFTSKPESRS
jgi:hypothetical protein